MGWLEDGRADFRPGNSRSVTFADLWIDELSADLWIDELRNDLCIVSIRCVLFVQSCLGTVGVLPWHGRSKGLVRSDQRDGMMWLCRAYDVERSKCGVMRSEV